MLIFGCVCLLNQISVKYLVLSSILSSFSLHLKILNDAKNLYLKLNLNPHNITYLTCWLHSLVAIRPTKFAPSQAQWRVYSPGRGCVWAGGCNRSPPNSHRPRDSSTPLCLEMHRCKHLQYAEKITTCFTIVVRENLQHQNKFITYY